MLGLRFYKNVQIDLWVGDPEIFFVDEKVRFSNTLALTSPKPSKHVGILCKDGDQDVFACIKETLDSAHSIRRVTVMLTDLTLYEGFQSSLFNVFPDK